ncbi:MAG: carboxylesterase family protein, partial [Maricaulis sp.]|nr:carboxylesterase family protein [Maricaulis sp.]
MYGFLRSIGLVLACGLMMASCSGGVDDTPVESLEETRRQISQGELVGFETAQGAHAWVAVPYAAPPVGDLRWRAPRPAEMFDSPLEALVHGSRCPQITNGLDEAEGLAPDLLVGDEDCLTLDIYAPPGAEDLPVMVWIHGGGNVWGRSAAYNGSRLALDQNVIVIAIQYRLGPLGWFAHPGLRADAETEADAAASFALLDMIAALEWVQANASAFGGDADRVTIFGESAGGHNVAGLMASPLARGLFHAGIIQSGIVWSVPLDIAESGSDWQANGGLEIASAIAGEGSSGEALR